MATLDVLTYGFGLATDQGSVGYSTNSLLRVGNHNILIDTGPSSRRPFLVKALKAHGLETDDIDIVILTHMHWDHCQNTDLFTKPLDKLEGVLEGGQRATHDQKGMHNVADDDSQNVP